MNVAARLEQSADPGEILVGETTFRLVRDAVEAEEVDSLDLRGRGEKVAARRLVSIRPDSPGTARRLETPLVGRENELRLLHDAFARVEREQGCHLFTLMGPAGLESRGSWRNSSMIWPNRPPRFGVAASRTGTASRFGPWQRSFAKPHP